MIVSPEPQLASDELAADARQFRHRLHRPRRHTILHMNGEGWPLTATYRDGFGAERSHEHHRTSRPTSAPRPTTIRRGSTGWRSRPRSARSTTTPPGPERGRRHHAPTGRDDGRTGLDTGSNERLHDSEDVGHLRRGVGRASRPAVPHGAPCVPTRTARSARTSSASSIRRSRLSWQMSDEDFFPQATLQPGQQPPPASRARRVRRAARLRTTPCRRSPQLGQHQGDGCHRPRRSTRSATTACGPSGRPNGRRGFDSQAVREPHAVRRHVLLASSRKDALISAIIAPSLGIRRDEPAREPRRRSRMRDGK